jgi:O-antigen ligase/polysaccharide polymerase Wzy-like membrane protein
MAASEPPVSRLGSFLAAPALLAGLPVLAIFFIWDWAQGGFAPTSWYPGALFLLFLVGVVVVSLGSGLTELPRASRLALVFLAAYAAWSFLSITWADARGDAWDGANRTLLYASVYALFALLPWRAGSASVLLGLYAVGTTLVGAIFLTRAVTAADPTRFFIDGRFASPAEYPNANCAMLLGAFWPALFLSSRREVPPLLRGVLLACAGFLVQLAVLPESRGSLVAVPIAVAFYLAIVPGRLRSVLSLALVGAATLAALAPLLDVYASRGSVPDVRSALDDAALAMALSFAVLFAAGTAIGMLDRKRELSMRTRRRASIAVVVGAAATAVAGAAVFLAVYGNPATRTADAWDEFKAGETANFGSSHFVGGLGSNRYDFWRAGVDQFKSAPLVGVGADNFAQGYLVTRRSGEEPLYPHSFEIRVLGQTGLVGAGLVAGFLAFALAAALRARGSPGLAGPAAAAAAAAFGYWFLHGSVDWFWEIPALTAPAIAWLGLAAALGRRDEAPAGRGLGRTAIVLGGIVAAGAASYTLPWIAARSLVRAEAGWRANPALAFDRLDLARRLNRLSDLPDLTTGAIAFRVGHYDRARTAFRRALERNPGNWYPDLELAILDSLEHRRGDALRRLESAKRKNPLEPTIEIVRRGIRTNRPVSPGVVDAMFVRRVEQRSS